jgi:diaminopimelate decarboxylase
MKPLDGEALARIADTHGTPCYVYDAATIRARARALAPFGHVRYAQKACSNVHVLRILRAEGLSVDATSEGEIERALRAGFQPGGDPAEIVYTADLLTPSVLDRVIELGIPVNAGSEDMLSQLGERRARHPVWLRINPGFGHGHSRKVNTGGEWSKHGIWHENLPDALARIDQHELDLVGLHVHIGSGSDLDHLQTVAGAMVTLVEKLGRDIRAISGGGGLPIPYRSDDVPMDVDRYSSIWQEARARIERHLGHAISLEIEPGRYLVAEAGFLVSEVRAVKHMGPNLFAVLDAGFNDLARPVMYGAHHDVTVLDCEGRRPQGREVRPVVLGGPLCESGDVFTQSASGEVLPRHLPLPQVGDRVVFHDAGAYGASMSSNYITRPLAAEVLLENGQGRLIRRRQTFADLLDLEDV